MRGRSISGEMVVNAPKPLPAGEAAWPCSESSHRCTARCSCWCKRFEHNGGGAGLQGVDDGVVSDSERTRLMEEPSPPAGELASSNAVKAERPGAGALAADGSRPSRAAVAARGAHRAGAASRARSSLAAAAASSGGCAPAEADSQKAGRPGARGGRPRLLGRPVLLLWLLV